MIETDIKQIKQHKIKTNKILKEISSWQTTHQKDDDKRFQEISDAISKLPTEDVITETIANTIKTVVNGKIDGIKADIGQVKEHLTRQDQGIEELSKKIKPLDTAKNWVKELAQIIMYVGGLAIAVGGIIEFLRLAHIIP